MKFQSIFLLALAALTLASCQKDPESAVTGRLLGEKAAFGRGYVQTYTVATPAGHPVEIGVVLSEEAFDHLPAEAAYAALALPAAEAPLAFHQVGFDWNPHAPERFGVHFHPTAGSAAHMPAAMTTRREVEENLKGKMTACDDEPTTPAGKYGFRFDPDRREYQFFLQHFE
jgi:hypothetical protein